MITTRSRYGLLFLVDLAENGRGEPLDLGGIAARQGIPEAYLAKLVAPLKTAGLLRSARGSKGGHELAKKPEDIDLMTIVETLEGRRSIIGGDFEPGKAEARLAPIWSGLDLELIRYLSGISLADAAGLRDIEYHI
jgi:Rrf2 family protein